MEKELLKHAKTMALQGGNFDHVQQLKHEINGLLVLDNLVLYLIQNTHSESNKHGSISFMIDNMHYVNFKI